VIYTESYNLLKKNKLKLQTYEETMVGDDLFSFIIRRNMDMHFRAITTVRVFISLFLLHFLGLLHWKLCSLMMPKLRVLEVLLLLLLIFRPLNVFQVSFICTSNRFLEVSTITILTCKGFLGFTLHTHTHKLIGSLFYIFFLCISSFSVFYGFLA